MLSALTRAASVAILLMAAYARADGWSNWGQVTFSNSQFGPAGAQLAADGTNLFFSTYVDGVYRASFADQQFIAMPMTGVPLWDANTNTNGLAITSIATTPQGTVVIAGSPINVTTNSIIFNPPGGAANTLPVFFWWNETNQLWQPSAISNKSYPYTGNVGNFSIAPDGSLWTCSGFYPYAYRSTNGGKNFTAFDINARVPANYFPLPLTTNMLTFGEVFSVCAGWNNEVVIGTETGGYLHTTNNGVTWASLDPNYTNWSSANPLGRTGDARVAGIDHYGNFLCGNYLMTQSPAQSNWSNVHLIGWRPRDNAVFNASGGLATNLGLSKMVTTPSGVSFCYMNQNYLLEGGIFRAPHGRDWSQFNQGSMLDSPFAPGLTNGLAMGNHITAWSNLVFIAVGNSVYVFDSSSPPITNRPPRALQQNVNLWQNTPANLTLTGSDADGNALNFSILTPPLHGQITGTPPGVTYTPTNNFTGLDGFAFVTDDGMATSPPAFFNLYVNKLTNTLSTVAITAPVDGQILISPTNLTITASASDPDGISSVNFYSGSFNSPIGIATNAPYTITLTNPVAGDYAFSARAFDTKGARTWSVPVRVSVLPVAPVLQIQNNRFMERRFDLASGPRRIFCRVRDERLRPVDARAGSAAVLPQLSDRDHPASRQPVFPSDEALNRLRGSTAAIGAPQSLRRVDNSPGGRLG